MAASFPSNLPVTAPRALYVLGGALLVVGVLLTPDFLLHLGILRASLTGEGLVAWERPHAEHIKQMALLQVAVGRGLFACTGAMLLLTAASWRALTASPVVRAFELHVPSRERPSWDAASLFGAPLMMLAAAVAGVFALNLAFARGLLTGDAVKLLAREDGLIEQLTALGFLVASLFALQHSRHLRGMRRVTCVVYGVGLFVCFGEELSWGQRIFGIDSGALADLNVQGELNIHNLMGKSTNVVFLLAWSTFGFAPALLARLHPFFHNLFDRLGVPVAPPSLVLGILPSWLLFDPIARRIAPASELRFEECIELVAALWFVLLALATRRTEARPPASR